MEILNYTNSFFVIFTLVSYFLIFNKRKNIAKFLGIIDIPNLERNTHKRPVPKTAILSLMVTLVLLLIFNLILNLFESDLNIIILGSVSIFLLGLVDDKFKLPAYKKLLLSFLIILGTISLSENLIIEKFYLETYDTFFPLNNFSIIFTTFCIILLINALNLSDGINGLAVGIIFFQLFFFISKNYNLSYSIIILLVLINLLITFFHTYKEKHFLGDCGSLMLPTLVGYLFIYNMNIDIAKGAQVISAEKTFIIFMLPGLDMLRLFIERIFKKKDPFDGDKNHLHHYLIKRNSLKKTLFIYFLMMNIPIILTWNVNFKSIYVIVFSMFFYILIITYLKKTSPKI